MLLQAAVSSAAMPCSLPLVPATASSCRLAAAQNTGCARRVSADVQHNRHHKSTELCARCVPYAEAVQPPGTLAPTRMDVDRVCDACERAAAKAVAVEVQPLEAQRLLQGISQGKAANVTDLHQHGGSSSSNMQARRELLSTSTRHADCQAGCQLQLQISERRPSVPLCWCRCLLGQGCQLCLVRGEGGVAALTWLPSSSRASSGTVAIMPASARAALSPSLLKDRSSCFKGHCRPALTPTSTSLWVQLTPGD